MRSLPRFRADEAGSSEFAERSRFSPSVRGSTSASSFWVRFQRWLRISANGAKPLSRNVESPSTDALKRILGEEIEVGRVVTVGTRGRLTVDLDVDEKTQMDTADIHVPLRVGTDAAFWMSVCQVMLAEELHQPEFLREQTDLAILVRKNTGRYLRASEIDGGRVPRGTLVFFRQ